MQTKQGRILQSLRIVQSFLDVNAERLPDIAASGARRSLDDVVAAVMQQIAEQSGSDLAAQGATQKYRALRAVLLRDHMTPIARIAAVELPASPELEALKMPRGQPTAERLQAHALGMARAAEPYASVFVASGLRADFVTQLTTAANEMIAALGVRAQSRVARRTATRAVRDLLSVGRKWVHALDARVQSALNDDPAHLAGWNMAKRVQLVPVSTAAGGSAFRHTVTFSATDATAFPSSTRGSGVSGLHISRP